MNGINISISILKAEKKLSALDKEYSAIGGNAEFCKLSAGLALGETGPNVTTVQVSEFIFIYLLRERIVSLTELKTLLILLF